MAFQLLRILGKDMERIEGYRYLGDYIDSRLNWKTNSMVVYKKGLSWLRFLRTRRSFSVSGLLEEQHFSRGHK